jgi:hypothetical protein
MTVISFPGATPRLFARTSMEIMSMTADIAEEIILRGLVPQAIERVTRGFSRRTFVRPIANILPSCTTQRKYCICLRSICALLLCHLDAIIFADETNKNQLFVAMASLTYTAELCSGRSVL